MNYEGLLKEARDLLVLCTMIDKSDRCQKMVDKIDNALTKGQLLPIDSVVRQSEQLCDCGKPVESAYDPNKISCVHVALTFKSPNTISMNFIVC